MQKFRNEKGGIPLNEKWKDAAFTVVTGKKNDCQYRANVYEFA